MNLGDMEQNSFKCSYPECFLCVTKERNLAKRATVFARFFKDLPCQDEDGQILAISRLWNTAMAHPNNPEFVELGIFECMASLVWKGIRNRRWLAQGENIYIPYYAAHIIGSYTMNVEEFGRKAVQAGVIPPLVELLKGKLTWVEQRVAVRALGHLASYESTFPYVSAYKEVVDLSMLLASNALDIVYTHFLQFVGKRLSYHCDLLTRGIGGLRMESRKAEEWASQLQCWSLQLLNCFALKDEFILSICRSEFLIKLPDMWGGLVNENSPAGIGLLRTICHRKLGRTAVTKCPSVINALCNIARSSDDWQYMAIDCLLWLVQDPTTRRKVLDSAAIALADLAELSSLGDHKKPGELILDALLHDDPHGLSVSLSSKTTQLLDNLANLRIRIRREKQLPKEDIRIKQAAALVVKLEGNAKFSSGNILGAISKYTESLAMCPIRAKRDRITLYSNRAQCYLLLKEPELAISDTTRALSLHNPVNRHSSSLWQRAQAYDILGLAKESLLDAIMFLNESSFGSETELGYTQNTLPQYVDRLIKRQMQAIWLFRDAAEKHGEMFYESDTDGECVTEEDIEADNGNNDDEENEASEWETASETDSVKEARRDPASGDLKEIQEPPKLTTFSKPSVVFKGVTLEDLLDPQYEDSH
ncbi:hypothetical protein O6H91_20G043800 [Diphasiastrum complanatum]|uniref:Uncharacterized protein n=5 Tax=Diphasiastrum complanatum TaxID=34168 RepID=A0ACC2APY5_DIPCM|nr:hypothetical protein O6H91_Y070900 [Diphasiastrum complanatum]KAJ7519548.1 hypothetical protein O6H91_20G043800 [Diphasiastrum complanatum]KAJ7519549.1 hypothetical protein O6H91_20G043800 [Diphasiastrum complanatum]KAJ7519550.1 hypothetical protein O6H91_20G043800 [Diphasiastrum complanatum]KAJ7519551.1 hypothetical protein O6H91_20G043800 [Diphasiastrum complanatum]